jgi:hypothetical protein
MMTNMLIAKMWTFVTGFLDTFLMTNQQSSKVWTFCHLTFGRICDVQPTADLEVDVLSHDF